MGIGVRWSGSGEILCGRPPPRGHVMQSHDIGHDGCQEAGMEALAVKLAGDLGGGGPLVGTKGSQAEVADADRHG